MKMGLSSPCIFGAFLVASTGLLSALSYEEALQVPLAPEQIRQTEARGPAAADWAAAADSWVAQSDSGEQRSGGALQVTDYYFSAGAGPEGDNRVFASLARPTGVDGPVPVILVFHGGGGHGDGFLAVSVARSNPGFAVLAMDYNGQFRPSENPVTQWQTVADPADLARGIFSAESNLITNAVVAARRSIDFLETVEGIDTSTVAAIGVSYGGWVAFRLAAADSRIDAVATIVSAGGVGGTSGYTARPERLLSPELAEEWRQSVEPMAAAKSIECPVFLSLGTNDRFFWLTGADRFKNALPNPLNRWLLRPNSDHLAGGPILPQSIPVWLRSVLSKDPNPPLEVRQLELTEDGQVTWQTAGGATASTLWWSPGDPVPPARYWRPFPAESNAPGQWVATVPKEWLDLGGMFFANTAKGDGFMVSSPLLEIPGDETPATTPWANGALWDTSMSADAWRLPLGTAGSRTTIDSNQNGLLLITTDPASDIIAQTDSIGAVAFSPLSGGGIYFRLKTDTPGAKVKVDFLEDTASLDQTQVSAEKEVDSEGVYFAWEEFGLKSGQVFDPESLLIEVSGSNRVLLESIEILDAAPAQSSQEVKAETARPGTVPGTPPVTSINEEFILDRASGKMSLVEMRSAGIESGAVNVIPAAENAPMIWAGRLHYGPYARVGMAFELPPNLDPAALKNARLEFFNGYTRGDNRTLDIFANSDAESLDWQSSDFRKSDFILLDSLPLRPNKTVTINVTDTVREAMEQSGGVKCVAFRLQLADENTLDILEGGKSAEHTQIGGPAHVEQAPRLVLFF